MFRGKCDTTIYANYFRVATAALGITVYVPARLVLAGVKQCFG